MRALIALALAMISTQALADDDHDRARRALARGEILPLTRILDVVAREAGGRVIEVEFDDDDGRYVYEVEVISRDGRLLELTIDAATGVVIERDYDDD